MKFLFFLCTTFLLGVLPLKLVEEYAFSGDFFEVDHLGNVYAITGNSVSVLNSGGIEINTFSDISLGDIYSIDVSNPLKIILYYKNSSRIIVLDNFMSIHSDPMDLFQLVDRDIQLVANSGSRNLWLYDQFSNQIIQVDYFMKLSNSTGVLANFLSQDFQPIKMIEKNEKLFVLSSNNKLAVFDVFGSFLYKINLPGVDDFQIEKNQVLYQKGNSMYFYDLLTHMEERVDLPTEGKSVIKKQGKKYYALGKDRLKVFE